MELRKETVKEAHWDWTKGKAVVFKPWFSNPCYANSGFISAMCTDSDPNKGALLSSSLRASAPCNKGFLTWQPVCSQTQSEFRNLQFINIMTQFCYNVEVSGGEISSWFGWYNLKGFACYMGATKSYTDTPKAQCRYMKTVSPLPCGS